jgi:tetratricopeptide (TPR) repeat protein
MIKQTARWKSGVAVCAVFAVVLMLSFWAYQPALDAPFYFDDFQNIVDSPAIRWVDISLENAKLVLDSSLLRSRPVANMSFALDHLRGGMEPRGFHLTNIVIHLLVGGILLWLSWLYARVTAGGHGSKEKQAASALLVMLPVALFMLHPLNTQAVTYVVQRMASLAALFTLLAFASYIVARYKLTARPRLWYAIALAAFLLGVGTKENAVLLLPVVFAYELCFFRTQWRVRAESVWHISWNRSWTIALWLILVGVTTVVGSFVISASDSLGLFAEFPERDFNGLERLLTQCRVQMFHLSQLFWPSAGRLNLEHHFEISRGLLDPGTTLPAVIACLALMLFAVVLAVYRPRYGFPLVAYALFHAIEAGPVNLELVFEHRMYLPLSMLVLLAAVLLADIRPLPRNMVIPLLCATALLLAGWTRSRNEIWADPFEFSRDFALKSPQKSRAQNNYAVALGNAGRLDDAVLYVKKAIELNPRVPNQWGLLGRFHEDLGDWEEAAKAYRTAIVLEPDSVKALLGLGRVLTESEQGEEALRLFLDAGIRLARGGRPMEAIPVLEAAASLAEADANTHNALANSYMLAGMGDSAVDQYFLALDMDPEMVSAWYNLGTVADSLDRHEDAVRAYEEFLRLAPDTMQQQISRAQLRLHDLRKGAGQ